MINEAYILEQNKQIMDLLRSDKLKEAHKLLKSSEKTLSSALKLENSSKIWAITFNNLANYYRKQGKFELSLHYFNKCLSLEKELNDLLSSAGTHLNICSIKSQLGAHLSAISHAQKAAELLQHVESNQNSDCVLVIALFHIGNEFDSLGKSTESSNAYLKAYELARQRLGNEHELTNRLKQVCKNRNSCKLPSVHRKVTLHRNSLKSKQKCYSLKENKRRANSTCPPFVNSKNELLKLPSVLAKTSLN